MTGILIDLCLGVVALFAIGIACGIMHGLWNLSDTFDHRGE